METFGMRLLPSVNTLKKQGEAAGPSIGEIASATFVILRRGNKLISTYHGRNDLALTITNLDKQVWTGLTEIQLTNLISGFAESGMVKR